MVRGPPPPQKKNTCSYDLKGSYGKARSYIPDYAVYYFYRPDWAPIPVLLNFFVQQMRLAHMLDILSSIRAQAYLMVDEPSSKRFRTYLPRNKNPFLFLYPPPPTTSKKNTNRKYLPHIYLRLIPIRIFPFSLRPKPPPYSLGKCNVMYTAC